MLLDKDFVMQGGVRNYLGKTEEVNNAPRYWQSSPTSPKTELSYITDLEKKLLLEANLHGSLKDGKPNKGASGLLSFDGGGYGSESAGTGGNDGFGGGSSGGGGGNDYTGSDYGFVVSQPTVSTPSGNINDEFGTDGNVYSGTNVNTTPSGNNYVVPDPQLPPGVISNNFDYETEAYEDVGKIESNFFNPETGQFTTTQSPGVIPAVDYQTSNIKAYLDSPGVTDKDKTDFLGRLKAISNSDLIGTNVDGIEDQFVIDNLDGSLNSILNQTKYSKYTDNIDEVAKTFESDLKNSPLSTIGKSGGVLGTFFKGVTDNYKNNKAMDLLGYTGSTIKYNPDGSGDFNYGGGFLTGNANQGERDAVNQLTPFAANAIGGTTQQSSMVNQYFANMNMNQGSPLSSDLQTSYNNAKNNISSILGTNQQFGYSAQPYGLLSSTNMADNPFNIPYLQQRGLI